MRSLLASRLGLVLAVALVGSACSDDDKSTSNGGQPPALDSNVVDAGTPDGAAPAPLAACVDRPGDLPRPPGTELPCELLPPGFSR
jgi:hypothetical protein